jgi:hypothetical protein
MHSQNTKVDGKDLGTREKNISDLSKETSKEILR